MPTLDQRLTTLERVSTPTKNRVTLIHLVSMGATDEPLTRVTHGSMEWHILPDESEAEFIARAQNELQKPTAILMGF